MALTGFNYNNETSNLLNTFGQIYRQKIMGPCGGGFGGMTSLLKNIRYKTTYFTWQFSYKIKTCMKILDTAYSCKFYTASSNTDQKLYMAFLQLEVNSHSLSYRVNRDWWQVLSNLFWLLEKISWMFQKLKKIVSMRNSESETKWKIWSWLIQVTF